MLLYALVELELAEAIELFASEDEARSALDQCLRDEPSWNGLLTVMRVELDYSPN